MYSTDSLSTGFWGPVTATIDWCEANYQFSRHIAESANTFSNLFTLSFALYGARSILREGLPARYLTSWAGLALVAVGSIAFHATLMYEAQMADELPMIYTTSWAVFVVSDTLPGFKIRFRSKALVFGITLFNVLFTWSYLDDRNPVHRNPVYHQIVFGAGLVVCTIRVTYLMKLSHTASTLPRSMNTSTTRLFLAGVGLFVTGFFIWNLDNIFCDTITRWKKSMGWPAAFLLEGHAWWHFFTGAGVYFMLQGNAYLYV
ncbi:unnamed protein product [Peniophora sp. CBMAI 1063]|nr:unnamed protein product [Peniophora sp. CBMAI 1063]